MVTSFSQNQFYTAYGQQHSFSFKTILQGFSYLFHLFQDGSLMQIIVDKNKQLVIYSKVKLNSELSLKMNNAQTF